MDPQVPQCSLQFWDVEWLLPLHLVIYEIPGILNRVWVGKLQCQSMVFMFFSLNNCCTSLSDVLVAAIMDRPERKQMVVQYVIEQKCPFALSHFLVGSVNHL